MTSAAPEPLIDTERPVALSVSGVAKSFGPTRALRGVSFDVRRGEIHALLGGNGSGKSTMIKVLAGVHAADAGEVTVNGAQLAATGLSPSAAWDAGLRFVHQQSSVFPHLTVAENLCLGSSFTPVAGIHIPWREVRRRAAEVLRRFEIDAHPDDQVGDLSPATQTMVAIARALQDIDADSQAVLVLDEPTASLSAHEVDVLLASLRRLADDGQTIIFVTHRLDEVLEVADQVTVLRDGALVTTVPRAELDHERLVELIMGRSVDRLAAGAERTRAREVGEVLTIAGATGGSLEGTTVSVRPGEIVGIAGLLGSGRTRLLRQLFGEESRPEVTFELDGRPASFRTCAEAIAAGVAYVPENRAKDASFGELSVLENISLPSTRQYFRWGKLRHREESRRVTGLVREFLVKTESIGAPMGSLSGGNQQKVVMARWLSKNPRLLLLDEPSQGVDVGSRFEIWELVRRATEQGTAVLVVSSDLEELAGVSDRVLVLERGAIVAEVTGDEVDESNLERLILECHV
ncbi:sugar ABC transporter ATP-binding protein [Nocardioides aromaticivorans]|uniref:sugar ABC transporter ATP-binding protein n=1 Tax=Nocardioides aromaticivorans TaxID=200618 RepID=UPI001A8EC4F1|nr:sugar ABC transporter ATP-binding protein [Nocardioides aromaticivorans]